MKQKIFFKILCLVLIAIVFSCGGMYLLSYTFISDLNLNEISSAGPYYLTFNANGGTGGE